MLSLMGLEIQQNLAQFVREGGNLIVTTQTGIKNWSNVVQDVSWPGSWGDMMAGAAKSPIP